MTDFDLDAAQRYLDNEEGTYEMVRYYLGQALDVIRERDEMIRVLLSDARSVDEIRREAVERGLVRPDKGEQAAHEAHMEARYHDRDEAG